MYIWGSGQYLPDPTSDPAGSGSEPDPDILDPAGSGSSNFTGYPAGSGSGSGSGAPLLSMTYGVVGGC